MEWLINRRRMMFNRVVPPEYLTFEDTEFWRLCCENWGDYNKTVIIDNGNNTVNIVTTLISMIGSTINKSTIVSSQYNVDNTSGTYIAGTTKEAVGITKRQCASVLSIARVFNQNTIIESAVELGKYFTSLVSFNDRAFQGCINLKAIDISNITSIVRYSLYNIAVPELVFAEGMTAIPEMSIGGGKKVKYVDFPTTITSIGNNNINNFAAGAVVVCRATTPPSLGTGNTSCTTIYVPSTAVEDYKAATDWSAQASKIQAIEGTWYETHRSLEPTT